MNNLGECKRKTQVEEQINKRRCYKNKQNLIIGRLSVSLSTRTKRMFPHNTSSSIWVFSTVGVVNVIHFVRNNIKLHEQHELSCSYLLYREWNAWGFYLHAITHLAVQIVCITRTKCFGPRPQCWCGNLTLEKGSQLKTHGSGQVSARMSIMQNKTTTDELW